MSGVFSQVLKEPRSPFSPTAAIESSSAASAGNTLKGVAGLAREFLTYKSGRYEQQDQRAYQDKVREEERSYQAALRQDQRSYQEGLTADQRQYQAGLTSAANQRADAVRQEGYNRTDLKDQRALEMSQADGQFISDIGREISNVREATLQGKQSKIVEAARIRRIQVRALEQRGDLREDIFSLDNDIAGYTAGDVEQEEAFSDQDLAQSVVNDAIKANPFLVQYNDAGSIDKAATFSAARDFYNGQQSVQRAKDEYTFSNQALQGAKLEQDIADRQAAELKARATEQLVKGHRDLNKTSALALMEQFRKAKASGSFDSVSGRAIFAETLANAESLMRDDLTELGIYESSEVESIIAQSTSDLKALGNLQDASEEAVTLALNALRTQSDYDLESSLGAIGAISRNNALSRAVFDNPILRMTNPESVRQGKNIYTQTLDGLNVYLNNSTSRSTPMSAQDAAQMTPIVQSVLNSNDVGTNEGTANALYNWTRALNGVLEGGPEAVSSNIDAIELLVAPKSRAKLRSIAQTNPELFNDIIPSINSTIASGFKYHASELVKKQGVNNHPWSDIEMLPSGDLKVRTDQALDQASSDAETVLRAQGNLTEAQIKAQVSAARARGLRVPQIQESVDSWNKFRKASSEIMDQMGIDATEQLFVFQSYATGLNLKAPGTPAKGVAGMEGSEGVTGGEVAAPFQPTLNSQME